jgi:hypothetical protein
MCKELCLPVSKTEQGDKRTSKAKKRFRSQEKKCSVLPIHAVHTRIMLAIGMPLFTICTMHTLAQNQERKPEFAFGNACAKSVDDINA